MNFTFSSPDHGTCVVKLWATGRYGFSLPKKVEIATPSGLAFIFLYFNKKLRLKAELSNRTIVRIAIASFFKGAVPVADGIALDPDTPPYAGAITPIRLDAPRAPMRVRPGKLHARGRA
jgi:hypothetical protein